MKLRTIFVIAFLSLRAATVCAEERVYTLQDAYEAALTKGEAIKLSEENAVQAESRVDQAWTYLYPRVTANGAYTRYNEVLPPGNGGIVFQPLDQYNASLVLTQPLYTGGRTLAALRAARTMRESSRSDYSTARQSIMFGVAEAYYAVVKARKLVEVSKNSLERMERHKKVTEREASTRRSKANASALLRANTLVNQASIALVRAQDGFKIARRRLSLLTTLPENLAVAEPASLVAPQGTVETMIDSALRNRDDYASAQLNRKASEEFVVIAKGAHYPQLYAEGGVRYQDSSPETAMDATTFYGGIRLQIPIFEGGLMNAEVGEARSKQRQAELASDLLRRQIESDVHEAVINYQTIDFVLATAGLQLEDAKKNFDTVEGLFSEGLVPSLSLIDAEQALSFSEKELVSATCDRQVAILRLEKSLGLLGKGTE
jgi:outer membrane protein